MGRSSMIDKNLELEIIRLHKLNLTIVVDKVHNKFYRNGDEWTREYEEVIEYKDGHFLVATKTTGKEENVLYKAYSVKPVAPKTIEVWEEIE